MLHVIWHWSYCISVTEDGQLLSFFSMAHWDSIYSGVPVIGITGMIPEWNHYQRTAISNMASDWLSAQSPANQYQCKKWPSISSDLYWEIRE